MTIIHLKRYYPYMTEDVTLEVSDEIAAALWHTTLLARCSVLYLLPRLTDKMRVSHDGHTRFARQESGQVFANGNEQKDCAVSESGGGYMSSCYTPTWLIQSLMFVPMRSISRLPNSPLCIITFRERSNV